MKTLSEKLASLESNSLSDPAVISVDSYTALRLENRRLISALRRAVEQRADEIPIEWGEHLAGFGGDPVNQWKEKNKAMDSELLSILEGHETMRGDV